MEMPLAARLAAPPACGQECLFPQIRDGGVIIYLVFKTSANAMSPCPLALRVLIPGGTAPLSGGQKVKPEC